MNYELNKSSLDEQQALKRLAAEARMFIRDKMRLNHWGPRKIEQALWAKHIDGTVSRAQSIAENEAQEHQGRHAV